MKRLLILVLSFTFLNISFAMDTLEDEEFRMTESSNENTIPAYKGFTVEEARAMVDRYIIANNLKLKFVNINETITPHDVNVFMITVIDENEKEQYLMVLPSGEVVGPMSSY